MSKQLKPFDLAGAQRGEPIQARDGRKAAFIAVALDSRIKYPVIAYIEGDTLLRCYKKDGTFDDCESSHTLVMSPRKVKGWINVFPARYPMDEVAICSNAYNSKESADQQSNKNRIMCLEIEVEI